MHDVYPDIRKGKRLEKAQLSKKRKKAISLSLKSTRRKGRKESRSRRHRGRERKGGKATKHHSCFWGGEKIVSK